MQGHQPNKDVLRPPDYDECPNANHVVGEVVHGDTVEFMGFVELIGLAAKQAK